jgi:hypothetical protein
MTPEPSSSRRYSDKEVRALLKRASELESQASALPAPVEGPTLSELEAIAEEAGINPLAVRRAAREMDAGGRTVAPSSPVSSAVLGAPLSVQLERVVQGNAPDSVLERLLPALHRASGGTGNPSLLGRTLTWQSAIPQSARALQVTVSAGSGGTHILIEERYGNLAGGLFAGLVGGGGGGIGLGVGVGVGVGALGSALFATLFPLAAIGGSFLLARSIYGSFVRKREAVLGRLMEEMVAVLEAGVETPETDAQPDRP